MDSSHQKLFDDIEKMKKGEAVKASGPLAMIAKEITKNIPKKMEIDSAHKTKLKNELVFELKQKQKQKQGQSLSRANVSIFERMFSFRPQNLIAYGASVALICLVVMFSMLALLAEHNEPVEQLAELSAESERQEETAPFSAVSVKNAEVSDDVSETAMPIGGRGADSEQLKTDGFLDEDSDVPAQDEGVAQDEELPTAGKGLPIVIILLVLDIVFGVVILITGIVLLRKGKQKNL